MNKLILLIIVIISTINISNCQLPKKGIGFEFHTFPTTFLIGETGSSMGVYFPFETATGLFIEPLLTYSSSSEERDYDDYYNDNDYEYSDVSWGISLGIFKSAYLNKMRTYGGIRIGKTWTVIEKTGYDDDERDAWIISPTFGAEHFIN